MVKVNLAKNLNFAPILTLAVKKIQGLFIVKVRLKPYLA